MNINSRAAWLGTLAVVLAGCEEARPPESTVVDSPGSVTIKAEVWADNWFAFYSRDRLILEDSTPVTTERSFNAEAFVFNADYPLQLNFLVRDFKENDTGLEYIGARNQQMGDGGLIAQFADARSGSSIAVTNADWRCLVIHEAPLDRSCADEAEPVAGVGPCTFKVRAEPHGWRGVDFDDRAWPWATEYSAADVRPKGGYDAIDWVADARLIWSGDLETHNTLLCRLTVPAARQTR